MPERTNVSIPSNTSDVSANNIALLFPDNSSNVELKREGWNQYVPVGFGTILHPTDLVKAEGSGSILCSDLTVQSIPERGRPPCPFVRGWLEYNEYEFGSGPRGAPEEIPYIIFPRNTALIDPNPNLMWKNTNSKSYTVSIRNTETEETIWEDDKVIGDSVNYPLSAPLLISSVDYLLIVKDNDTGYSSLDDPAKGLGFELLNDDLIILIEQRQSEIFNHSNLDESAKNLALAIYYLNFEAQNSRRIWGEALLILEDIAKEKRSPAVYLQLGNTLLAIKLQSEAEVAFETALQLAEMMRDLEAQASAYIGLWHVFGDSGYMYEALSLYKELGDQSNAEKYRQ